MQPPQSTQEGEFEKPATQITKGKMERRREIMCIEKRGEEAYCCYGAWVDPGLGEEQAALMVEVGIYGWEVWAMVDLGSSQTIVWRDLIQGRRGEAVDQIVTQCLCGDTLKYNRVRVTTQVGDDTHQMLVGVVNQSPYPVTLGCDWPELLTVIAYERQNVELARHNLRKVNKMGESPCLSPFQAEVEASKDESKAQEIPSWRQREVKT